MSHNAPKKERRIGERAAYDQLSIIIQEHCLRYFDETFISTEAFGKGEELNGMFQKLKDFFDL